MLPQGGGYANKPSVHQLSQLDPCLEKVLYLGKPQDRTFRCPLTPDPCYIKQTFPPPYSLFPIPYSLFPIPYSLFPIPYPLSPTPYPLPPIPSDSVE